MTILVRLRPLTAVDAHEMTQVLSDPALYEYIGGQPPTEEQLHQQYTVQARGHSEDGTERWINELVILQATGEAIGYVQATIPASGQPTEIAWVIGTAWQGQGYATQAAALLASQLADVGARDLVARIHPDHAASAAVARRLGLHPTETVVDGEIRWEGSVSASGSPQVKARREGGSISR